MILPLKASHFGIDDFRREVVLDSNCGLVCEVLDRGAGGQEVARLFAAAPELLDALTWIIRSAGYESGECEPKLRIKGLRVGTHHLDVARAVIAKARSI